MMHHTYRIIIEDIDGEDIRDIQKTAYDDSGLGAIWVNGRKLFILPADVTAKMRAYDFEGAKVKPFAFTLIRA